MSEWKTNIDATSPPLTMESLKDALESFKEIEPHPPTPNHMFPISAERIRKATAEEKETMRQVITVGWIVSLDQWNALNELFDDE